VSAETERVDVGPDVASPPPPATEPPTLREMLPLIVVISTGALIVNLDAFAVNVALDTLSREFNAPLSSIEWVVTGYVLALAAAVPLTGWASHRLGARRLWMTALGLFIGASALSGAAWSTQSLIVFRVLQGLGGGMVLPAGHGIIVRAAHGRRLGSTMSVVNLPLLIGPVFGPVIGGILVGSIGWRSIFYINIPICGAVLWRARKVIPASDPERGRKLDWRGMLMLSPGLVLLIYALSQAGYGGRVGVVTLLTFGMGLALIAAFVAHTLRLASVDRLIDVALFARRAFAVPVVVALLFSFMMQGALVLYPLYWQIVRARSPLEAGLLIGPQGIGSLITVLFIGRLSDRYGGARLAPIGLVILAAGTIVWAGVGPHTSYLLLAGATFARGFGISFLGTPAYAAAYQSLSPSEAPRGTTVYNIVQRCGTAFGVAISIVVLQFHFRQVAPKVAHHGLSTGQLSSLVSRGHAAPIATAFAHSFVVLTIVTLITFVPALMMPWRGARAAT
jgi:EmrB/QacA subfamily drug resistance transporter